MRAQYFSDGLREENVYYYVVVFYGKRRTMLTDIESAAGQVCQLLTAKKPLLKYAQ